MRIRPELQGCRPKHRSPLSKTPAASLSRQLNQKAITLSVSILVLLFLTGCEKKGQKPRLVRRATSSGSPSRTFPKGQ